MARASEQLAELCGLYEAEGRDIPTQHVRWFVTHLRLLEANAAALEAQVACLRAEPPGMPDDHAAGADQLLALHHTGIHAGAEVVPVSVGRLGWLAAQFGHAQHEVARLRAEVVRLVEMVGDWADTEEALQERELALNKRERAMQERAERLRVQEARHE